MTADWYRIANEADVPSPALLLYPDRIEKNLHLMIDRAGGADRLRPHVKTHKMPQIVSLALARGITKFKAATIAEAEMAAAAGAADVLLAYPVVGPNAGRLAALVRAYPRTLFRTLADSKAGVEMLSRAAVSAGVTIDVLLDVNVGMDRTGIAPGEEAAALYATIASSPGLTAGGLHAYDGHLRDPDQGKLSASAADAFAPFWKLRDELRKRQIAVPLLIASGTPTFPILAAESGVEVGPGTTVLWDFGQQAVCPDLPFLFAAVLLTRVISRPTPNRLCLDLGHKAVASEMPHPRVRLFGLEDAVFVAHSEEHLVVETERADAFPVGTALYGIPRHVCPTVALHAEVVVVRDGRAAESWPVVARGRRITI